MDKADTMERHSFATRLIHLLLALAAILQLLTSLAMHMPHEGRPGDALFAVHQFSGLSALVLSLGFWSVVVLRRRGTAIGRLWPWFSEFRRLALLADTQRQWLAIKSWRLPVYDPEAALPSAVHGLGLVLITAMAASGASYYVALLLEVTDNWTFKLILEMHQLLANFAWAYILGHAGLALIHHFTGTLPLTAMWPLRRSNMERPSDL